MALDSALNLYTFDGISFERANFNYGDPVWPVVEAIRSKTLMMGGGATRDTAGGGVGSFSITGRFDTVADRNEMVAKAEAGRIAVLSKSLTGESRVFTLASAQPVLLAAGLYGADMVFE